MTQQRYDKNYRIQTSNKILRFIKTGTSVSVLGMPGEGKTDFLNFIVNSCNIKTNGVICLKFNVNDLVSITELNFYKNLIQILMTYIQETDHTDGKVQKQIDLAEKSLASNEPTVILTTAKKMLTVLLEDTNAHIGIFIDGFIKLKNLPTSFFNSLHALRTVNKFRIAYIFIDDLDLTKAYRRKQIGDMYDLMTNKVLWLPLPTKDEGMKIIHNCETLFNCTLGKTQRAFIWNLTRGHASLTKYLTLFICENKEYAFDIEKILDDSAIKTRIEKILGILNPMEVEILRQIATEEDHKEIISSQKSIVETLIKYQIIKKTKNILEFFSPLITQYLMKKKPLKAIVSRKKDSGRHSNKNRGEIQIKSGEIFVNGDKIKTDLTRTEFDILSFLLQNKNKVVTRDDIAKIMWQDKVGDKYSDWAIDRAISRLRKKIGDNAYRPTYLKTLRGRGFKLSI